MEYYRSTLLNHQGRMRVGDAPVAVPRSPRTTADGRNPGTDGRKIFFYFGGLRGAAGAGR